VVESPADFRRWVGGLKDKIPPSLLKSIDENAETNPELIGAGGA
jgi:hypothetical protein